MNFLNFLILLLFSFALFTHIEGQKNKCEEKFNNISSAQIILSFTPVNADTIRGNLVIYYFNPEFKPNDTITVHVNETDLEQKSTHHFYPTSSSGIINTEISARWVSYSDELKYKEQCLGYSTSWVRDGVSINITCLSTRPNWMYQYRKVLRNRALSSVIIPGTHNSGSYSKTIPQSMVDKFAATQDKDIFEQLVSGARYFDLRPGNKNGYWIVHGGFFMNNMEKVINDVKAFMNNTHEIVILSFKEFPIGFSESSDHLNFIQYLENQFKGYLLRRASKLWEITFREIWKFRTRLIISYDNNLYKRSAFIWPPIRQMWGDVRLEQGLDGLKNYLKLAENTLTFPRASMAEYTLDAYAVINNAISDVLGMTHTSLMQLAATVGPNVTQWYNELFYRNASIIAVDYLDTTGIVEVAIEWNKRRFSPCYYRYGDIIRRK